RQPVRRPEHGMALARRAGAGLARNQAVTADCVGMADTGVRPFQAAEVMSTGSVPQRCPALRSTTDDLTLIVDAPGRTGPQIVDRSVRIRARVDLSAGFTGPYNNVDIIDAVRRERRRGRERPHAGVRGPDERLLASGDLPAEPHHHAGVIDRRRAA